MASSSSPSSSSSSDAHIPNEGTSRMIVILSLVLFFVMSVIGHYVFIVKPAGMDNHSAAMVHKAQP